MRLKKKILRYLTSMILIVTFAGCGNIGKENANHNSAGEEKNQGTIVIPINNDLNGVNKSSFRSA